MFSARIMGLDLKPSSPGHLPAKLLFGKLSWRKYYLFETFSAFGYTETTVLHGLATMNTLEFAGRIGRGTISRIEHLIELCAFASRILKLLVWRPPHGRVLLRTVIVEQIYFTAVQALSIVVPIALLIGTTLIIQFVSIASQNDLGQISVMIIVRELGPLITALIVILRSATAVTIETGYMKVLHELDSIEMSGIDPLYLISLPRLLGITTAILCLFIVFDIVAILGGWLVVWTITDLPVGNFMRQIGKAISINDILQGIVKGIVFGIVITVTSLYRGFKVRQQITDIPIATSQSSVECLFYCLILSLIISLAFY